MKEKEIQEGIKLLRIDIGKCKAKEVMPEDIFTAYRNFSAYESKSTTYSSNTTSPRDGREHNC